MTVENQLSKKKRKLNDVDNAKLRMEKKRKKNQSEVIISNNKKIYSKQIEKKKDYQQIIKLSTDHKRQRVRF
jgi:hypothetical protein